MPNNNEDVTFKYGKQNAYDSISQIDDNAIYVTTDTHKIYIGGVDYTTDTQINSNTKQYVDSSISDVVTRIDNIISHNNDAEGNSELIDIRNGVDGTVYGSAGSAVRKQLGVIIDKQNSAFNSIPISWKYGKSLDRNTEVAQSNRCITDYIDLSGRYIDITVPEGEMVKYSILYYDENKQYVSGTNYILTSGSYNGWVNGSYLKYIRLRVGMKDDSVPTVYSELTNRFHIKLSGSDVMQYRGNLILLGLTAFSQCTLNGYYSFTTADLNNISDSGDITTGGIIRVENSAATMQRMQTIVTLLGEQYFRYGQNPFKLILNSDDIQQYRGNIQSLGYSSIHDCAQTGYYNCPTAYINNLQDKPSDLTLGFIVEVHKKAGGGTTYQTITDNNGDQWFRYASQPFVRKGSNGHDGYEKPVWYALGDSITQGFYSYMNGDTPAISTTTNCWAKIVADKAGFSLTNYGVGGSGFVHNATVGDHLNARDHIDTIDFSSADIVTIAFGINDWKGSNTFGSFNDDITTGGTVYSNMRYVIEKILTDNPECKVFIITPINASKYGNQSGNWSLSHTINGKTLEDMFQLEKTVADYYGIELIDMTHSSVFNRINCPALLVDGVHPTLRGHQLMGAELSRRIHFS